MFILSPAKLNLCLFVLTKREDGYHDILSVVQKVDLCDEIEIEEHTKNSVEFESTWYIPQSNSISKTLEQISQVTRKFYKVRVIKRIPPGGGLGGASSNAGVIIKKLCENLGEEKMKHIAEIIGSDVTLFLKNSPSIISGRGENVCETKIKGLESAYFVVVFPNISSATSSVYRKFDEMFDLIKDEVKRIEVIERFQRFTEAIFTEKREMSLDEFGEFLGWNDLEAPFLELYDRAKEVKSLLSKFGKFHLTGSGSSFFAVFSDPEEAKETLHKVKRYFAFSWLLKPFQDVGSR